MSDHQKEQNEEASRRIDISLPGQAPKQLAVVHHVLIIDESGSMLSCRQATVAGINQQLSTIKQTQDSLVTSNFVTLVFFNDQHRTVLSNQPCNEVQNITYAAYLPQGNTALYDTVVSTIKQTEAELGEDCQDRVLLSIFTDGANNICKQYTASDAAREIERVQKKNWTVTYVGANHDVGDEANNLNIPAGNTMSYSSDPDGAARAFGAYATSSALYCRNINKATETNSKTFFSENQTVRDLTTENNIPGIFKVAADKTK